MEMLNLKQLRTPGYGTKVAVILVFVAMVAATLLVPPPTARAAWDWNMVGSHTPGSAVNALACDGKTLYAGCINGTVYQNDFSGGAWTQTGSNTPGWGVFSLAYHDKTLYAGCWDGSVRQNDLTGGPWTQTGNTPSGTRVNSLAYYDYDKKLYAGCSNGYVYQNDLQGGNWKQTGSGLSGSAVYSLAYNKKILYAGCLDGKVYENNLQGGNWTQTGSGTTGSAVFSLAYGGSRLYAGCQNGTVWQNDLPGGTWTQTGSGSWGSDAYVYSLAYDGTRLYAGYSKGFDGTVYQNDLQGGDWTKTGNGLSGSPVSAIAYDGTKLYAGRVDGKVYQNDLQGGDWTQTVNNRPGQSIYCLAFFGKRLYAGCYIGDVYRIQTVYTVAAQVQGGGTATPSSRDVPRLHNATIDINPNTGYHAASVTDNGAPVTPTPTTSYTIDNVTEDHDLVVTFAINTYSVNASVSGGHGTVSTSTQTVNHGGSALIDIKPDEGYHTASVTDNGTTVTSIPTADYTIDNVHEDHNVVVTFARDETVTASSTWYLAEGSTAWGVTTYITIENPNNQQCTAAITYNTEGGARQAPDVTLPPMSQTTVNPSDVVPDQDFSTVVTCKEEKTIAVDRTMSWTGTGAGSSEAHSSVGVTAPSKTWYLPEGSSDWGFETWLLIQNPNGQEATCTVTYMTENNGPIPVEHTVPPNSRKSYSMEADIGKKDASIKVECPVPVIPERAVYRNDRREGHDSIGTTTPSTDYYLAEGTTAWGFTTYVLVQNPQSTPTDVTITYMTPTGPVYQVPFQMPANSRKTVKVNDILGGTDLSTQVHGSQPIIAERAMYWDNRTGEACHDSIGMASSHACYYLPDGETSNGRETWTLVQNPNASPVAVEVSYLTQTGAGNVVFYDNIPANSRKTYNMADSGLSGRAAVMVTSETPGQKIMVERAMYWNNRGAGTDTVGGYSD